VAQLAMVSIAPAPDGAVSGEGEAVPASSRHGVKEQRDGRDASDVSRKSSDAGSSKPRSCAHKRMLSTASEA